MDINNYAAPTAPQSKGNSNSRGTFLNVDVIDDQGRRHRVALFLAGSLIDRTLDVSGWTVAAAELRGYDPAAPKDRAASLFGE